jgi:succinate dehydrogenase/fumarate reductase cytochrome b subunit
MHPSGCGDKAGLHQTQSIGGKGMIAFAFFHHSGNIFHHFIIDWGSCSAFNMDLPQRS